MEDLKSWSKNFLQYKHSIKRDLKEIRVEKEIITTVSKEEKKVFYAVLDKLENRKENIFCKSTEENFEFLIENFENFVKTQNVIYFVNFEKNNYWAINPHHHNKITNKKNLKKGLKALFDSSEIN